MNRSVVFFRLPIAVYRDDFFKTVPLCSRCLFLGFLFNPLSMRISPHPQPYYSSGSPFSSSIKTVCEGPNVSIWTTIARLTKSHNIHVHVHVLRNVSSILVFIVIILYAYSVLFSVLYCVIIGVLFKNTCSLPIDRTKRFFCCCNFKQMYYH